MEGSILVKVEIPYGYEIVNGEYRSTFRGFDKLEGGEPSKKFDSISEMFADIVTGPFNQDVSCLFVGQKGSGKSFTVVSIAYHTACAIAEINGGQWSDYYDLERYTAIILETEANRLMQVQDKFCIKNYDDIGIGWGARNWRDQENIDKNDIFQINRIDNTVQLFSVPNQFLLDKVPRSLVSHYVEMEHKFFEKGFTVIKLFKPKTMFREQKIFNPYLQIDRQKYVNYLIPKPPHFLAVEYKHRRQKNTEIAIQMRKERKEHEDAIRKARSEKELKQAQDRGLLDERGERQRVLDVKYNEWDNWFAANTDKIIEAVKQGMEPNKALGLVIRSCGMTASCHAYFKRKGHLKKYNIDKVSSA